MMSLKTNSDYLFGHQMERARGTQLESKKKKKKKRKKENPQK